jgi:hypothetical protein
VHIYDTQYIKSGLNPVPEVVLQASNKYKENFDVVAKFDADRIREPITDEERLKCRTEPIDSGSILKIFRQWKKEAQLSFDDKQLISRISLKYGEPERSKFWTGIFVYDNDADVKEFDRAHAENPLH